MTNGDKLKSAKNSDAGKKAALKRRAINDAQKKAYIEQRHMRGRHNAASHNEDSTRLTAHELEMLEQKKKREAKEASALEFQRRVEEAAEQDAAPVLDFARPDLAIPIGNAERHWQGHIVHRTGPVVKDGLDYMSEQRKAQVAAMVAARQMGFERARHAAVVVASATTQPMAMGLVAVQEGRAHADAPASSSESDEDRLDRALDSLLERRLLSESQIDQITDELASGRLTSRRCLEELWSRFR